MYKALLQGKYLGQNRYKFCTNVIVNFSHDLFEISSDPFHSYT